MTDSPKPWTTVSSRTVYENTWLRVIEDQVLTPGGARGVYGVVQHPSSGSCVLPIDLDGCTWLVGQYRYAIGRYTWELPAGSGARGSDPLETARRELAEETGLAAQHWHPILHMAPVNSVTNLEAFSYVAWDLTPGTPHPDAEEELALRRLPFAELLDGVLGGSVTNAITVATVLQAHVLALRGRLPPAVTPALRAAR